MVSSPFYSRYQSSVDAGNLDTSFSFNRNSRMAGFIANIVEVGGLRRRGSSSSRSSVSDENLKRPSLLRHQATGEPSITTYKESVSRSPYSSGRTRTRTATDILSRVVVSTQLSGFSSPIESRSPSEPLSPKSISSDSDSPIDESSISLSDAYFSFPRFGSWNGEDEFDCDQQQTEL